MKTKLKSLLAAAFIIAVLTAACNKDEETILTKANEATPTDTTNIPDSTIINQGPQLEDYDFYISMCYSDPQPADENMKHFYILVACEDSTQTMETVEMKIQGTDIPLEYANYGGPDFYIAYYDMAIADTFYCELTMNGVTTSANLEIPSELNANLPVLLETGKDLDIIWEMEKNPHVIYIEGFQRDNSHELLKKEVENLTSETRSYTIPADWLWSEENTSIREIQLGIMNYTIENRVCFTMSDGAYKVYQ